MRKRINRNQLMVFFVFGLIVFIRGPIYLPDSYAHMDMLINRSPVYAIFVNVFTAIFKGYYEYPLLFSQYLFLVLSIRFLLKILSQSLKVSSVSVLLLQLVLLANGIYWFASVNKVLSESIAFPLFLILVGCLFKASVEKNYKWLFKGIITLILLQFTRGQFISFLPVLLIFLSYITYKTKSYRKGLIFVILIISIPLVVSFSERAYNKIVHNQYKNYSMTYVHFISLPFYIADSNNVEIFETEEEKSFFNRTYQLLKSKKINRDFAISNNKDDYAFFEANFTKICNASIHEANMDYYADFGFKSHYDQQYKVDEVTAKMFFPLLKANFKVWLKVVFKSFEKGLGGRPGAFLTFLILILSIVLFFKDNRFVFLSIVVLLKLANSLIIAMVVHSIIRYTFYFEWITGAVVILLLDLILKERQNAN